MAGDRDPVPGVDRDRDPGEGGEPLGRLAVLEDEAHRGVANLRVVGGLVTDVWIVLNPDKLARWT